MLDPFSHFSFQPVVHSWYNNGYDIYSPISGIVQRSLAVNKKRVAYEMATAGFLINCGSSNFSLSLFE